MPRPAWTVGPAPPLTAGGLLSRRIDLGNKDTNVEKHYDFLLS